MYVVRENVPYNHGVSCVEKPEDNPYVLVKRVTKERKKEKREDGKKKILKGSRRGRSLLLSFKGVHVVDIVRHHIRWREHIRIQILHMLVRHHVLLLVLGLMRR